MIKEAIGTGSSIEEAKEAALLELDAKDNDDIQFDIISFPKKKALGLFGGTLAQVRAYVELPDPKPAKKNENRTKKAEPRKEKVEKAPKAEKPSREPEEAVELTFLPEENFAADSKPALAIAYLKQVLTGLGCGELVYTVAETGDCAHINISGDDTGVIIGHRGETLDALQYLAGLAASKKGNGFYRVVLDIGDYRERREKTLENVARKTAAQVLRTGRSRSLEPMNPFERRIIHTTVQGIEGVTSGSVGGGSARRVVISPEGGDRPRAPRNDRGHASTVSSTKTEKTEDATALPLYGRIN